MSIFGEMEKDEVAFTSPPILAYVPSFYQLEHIIEKFEKLIHPNRTIKYKFEVPDFTCKRKDEHKRFIRLPGDDVKERKLDAYYILLAIEHSTCTKKVKKEGAPWQKEIGKIYELDVRYNNDVASPVYFTLDGHKWYILAPFIEEVDEKD